MQPCRGRRLQKEVQWKARQAKLEALGEELEAKRAELEAERSGASLGPKLFCSALQIGGLGSGANELIGGPVGWLAGQTTNLQDRAKKLRNSRSA